jgi:hypothetical protein
VAEIGLKAKGKVNALSEIQYPHWLMVTGAVLAVLGFIGVAFRKNKSERDRG